MAETYMLTLGRFDTHNRSTANMAAAVMERDLGETKRFDVFSSNMI